MSHSRFPLLVVICLCVLFVFGCRKDDGPAGSDPNDVSGTIVTTLSGIVTDESGTVLGGVAVSAYGHSTITNPNGLFVLSNVRVPGGRCVILAQKAGYFNNSRAGRPVANGITRLHLGLLRTATGYSVNSAVGGTVKVSEGGSVQLPAHAYVTEDGQPYTGTVKVVARWIDPTSSNFYSLFPGDFRARRTDNSETTLYSYGVLNVELYTSTGAKLQLSADKKATLSYPIPSSMLSSAPSSIPLWYYDETIGMWKEDGSAVKQGNTYVGDVSHFTPWNVDVPSTPARIQGHVFLNNKPFEGCIVSVGQSSLVTDATGYYECEVPTSVAIEVSVNSAYNKGIGSNKPRVVGPLAPNDISVQNFSFESRLSYITGVLVDCNNKPVEGVVEIRTALNYSYVFAGKDGRFRATIFSDANEPDAAVQIICRSYAGTGSGTGGVSQVISAEPVPESQTRDIGTVILCNTDPTRAYTELTERTPYELLAFSNRGALLVSKGHSNTAAQVYSTETGAFVKSIEVTAPQYAVFSEDDSRLFVISITGVFQIWDTRTWKKETQLLLPSMNGAVEPMLYPGGDSIAFVYFNKATSTREVVLFNLKTFALTKVYSFTADENNESAKPVLGIRGDGNIVLSLWSTQGKRKVVVLKPGVGAIVSTMIDRVRWSSGGTCVMARNGSRFALYNKDNIEVFDAGTGARVCLIEKDRVLYPSLLAPDVQYAAFAFSPDGSAFAASFSDVQKRPLGIYSSSNGELLKVLSTAGQGEQVYADNILFSPDGSKVCGRFLADGAPQRIWNLR